MAWGQGDSIYQENLQKNDHSENAAGLTRSRHSTSPLTQKFLCSKWKVLHVVFLALKVAPVDAERSFYFRVWFFVHLSDYDGTFTFWEENEQFLDNQSV